MNPKSSRGGPRFGTGPRGPLPGAQNAGRPPLPQEAQDAIAEALMADGATVSSVARDLGHGRVTVRRIRDERGIEAKLPSDNARK